MTVRRVRQMLKPAAFASLAVPALIGITNAGAIWVQSFDAASIKPASPSAARAGRLGAHVTITPGSLAASNATLKELVADAYTLEDYQVTGGPAWVSSTRFDLQAKPASQSSRAEQLAMLQKLLADRFQLGVHRGTREMAVYAINTTKDGPKPHPPNRLTVQNGRR